MRRCRSRSLYGVGWAVITGASSGLGRALAKRAFTAGWSVVLVARREGVLHQLAAELQHDTPTDAPDHADAPDHTDSEAKRFAPRAIPIAVDLMADTAVDDLQARLETEGIDLRDVSLLINNAGVGDHGIFLDLDPRRLEATIALGVTAVTRLAHRFAPEMCPGATICTVASVAAFTPGPLMAVYYASKAYALSLGESLHEELEPRGVRVVTVCPGPFASEFHHAAGIATGRRLPTAEAVSKQVLAAVRRGRAVAPLGGAAWLWALLGPRLPRRIARRLMHRVQARRG